MAAKKKTKAKKPSRGRARKTARGAVRRRRPAARRHVVRRQPESLRLHSMSPSFTVNDIGRSLAFYRDVLGLTVRERWEEGGVLRGVELVAGGVSLWLAQDDWKQGRDRVKGQGFRIYCTTGQDIDALAARIRASGAALAEEPKDQPWGGRDFAVVDPDGFKLSIASEG
jgi:uncharacterized glyoxalase superfamily protein PhnB